MDNVNLKVGGPMLEIILDRLYSNKAVKVEHDNERYKISRHIEIREGVVMINYPEHMGHIADFLAPYVGYPIYMDEDDLVYKQMRMRDFLADGFEDAPFVLDMVGISRLDDDEDFEAISQLLAL